MKKRVALIVDNLKITNWQKSALEYANESIEIVMILNCQNSINKKNYFKNFLYYLLNMIFLKNNLTRKYKINFKNIITFNFNSKKNGSWESIPSFVYDAMEKEKIEIVIKFGMGLLKIDKKSFCPTILSYHHGDPTKYRGRPAGFYEIINGENTIGIIVQKINNKIDAGTIYASAISKVFNFSYKKTASNFYDNSKYLLKKAIDNHSNKQYVEQRSFGKNYSLPSNFIVIKFILILFCNLIKKIFYGLFFEKKWKVAITDNKLLLKGNEIISLSNIIELPIREEYNFYADPFFSEDGKKIRLEALNNKTGLGDILEISTSNFLNQKILFSGKHFSYPFSFTYHNKEYLMPEVANHSAQKIYLTNQIQNGITLNGLQNKRIVDGTIFFKDGIYYLFFGDNHNAHSVLNLWFAKSPIEKFKPHPMSPIAISPMNARMGGKLIKYSNKIFRFGQNNSNEYGESLVIIEIISLSQNYYEEREIGTLKIDELKGPHSICFSSDMKKILFDYYKNRFSLLAGFRRLKAKLNNI